MSASRERRTRSRPVVQPFEARHVPAAAAIVARAVARLRTSIPVLPDAWTDEDVVARVLRALAHRGNGGALIADGALVGFQAATLLDGHGGRWAYTSDIGHGVDGDALGLDADRLIEQGYVALADRWVREACVEHVVTILADDAAALAAFGRLGFAPHVVDLVRDLSPVPGAATPGGLVVRAAFPGDAAAIADLHAGLVRHLRASPVFLRIPNAPPVELQRRRLEEPAAATFVATRDDRPVAFLRIGPSADDVATIVRDPGTASITGAFTLEEHRGDGVATALLDAALAWARVAGYVRAGVDHEAANGEAGRFWARHFTPVALSLSRRLRPAAVPGAIP